LSSCIAPIRIVIINANPARIDIHRSCAIRRDILSHSALQRLAGDDQIAHAKQPHQDADELTREMARDAAFEKIGGHDGPMIVLCLEHNEDEEP